MSPAAETAALARPRLRGVIHHYFFFVAATAGALLVRSAPPGKPTVEAAVYAGSLASLLGVSALYHRIYWPPRRRAWMRRLDHGSIFLLIAGTFTPLSLVLGDRQPLALALIWTAAALGVAKATLWPFAPKWVNSALCVAMGWGGVFLVPAVLAVAGPDALGMMAAGGLLYTIGAVFYAARKPNLVPGVFGYHELFHALVVAASACHYAAVLLVLQRVK